MLMIVSVILTFSLSLSLCSFSTQKMLQETFPEASSPVVLLIFYTQSAQQIQDLTIHRFRRHADGLGRNLQSFQHKHNISDIVSLWQFVFKIEFIGSLRQCILLAQKLFLLLL